MDYEKKLVQLHTDYADWWKKGFELPHMTANLFPYDTTFSPIKVNRLTLKNRLVMAPMGNICMCDETGRPNAKMLKYFEERAKGGVGLITSGLVPVSYKQDKSLYETDKLTYFPRIDRSRTVFAGWRDLAAICHAHGSHFFIQLTPGLGRVGNPQCLVSRTQFPRSSSLNPNWYIKDIPCLPLTDHSIKQIVKNIGQGAADAKAANIDGVYLHGHEGYLMEQLTNTAFNRRSMGRYANPMNFGLDCITEIRRRVGDDFPIMYRIDMSLMLNATYGDNWMDKTYMKKFKNERSFQQTLDYMKELVKVGVDMFDVDLGCYDNWWLPHPPSSMPSGCFLDIAKLAKDYFAENNIKSNKGLEVPIVGVGKLGYPDLAEQALRDKKCDMVMLGRPLLADPEWPNKAYAGKCKDIRPCIGCQEGCLNEFVEGGHPQCAINPRTAFEEEYTQEIPLAPVKKKVAIVGAGPAGITMAETLLARGHQVDLYEKENKLGGVVVPGSVPLIKYEIKNYLDWLNGCVETMKNNIDFKLHLNTTVDAEYLKNKGYDVIVTANGARQVNPPVEGIDRKNVFSAIAVLNDASLIKDARDVVVVGGGVVGAELAYYLTYELNKNVKVVEMDKYIMNHACTANRGHIIHYLEQAKVELLNMTTLKKIEDGKVIVEQNVHKNVPNPYITWSPILPENVENPMDKLRVIKNEITIRELKADAVILATGNRSQNELYYACLEQHAALEIFNIGDSLKGARVFEAVRGAYRKGRTI